MVAKKQLRLWKKEAYMQQFALASTYPRSIAWLIRADEWSQFEEIIKYNCAMVGGYYNVFIPLTNNDTVSKVYQNFLKNYDPDIVVLAPNMSSDWAATVEHLQPYGFVSWEALSQIASTDPWSSRTGMNAVIGGDTSYKRSGRIPIVAAKDSKYPDMSRLALVSCGEVFHYGFDHKKEFLDGIVKLNQVNKKLDVTNSDIASILPEVHKFPLSNISSILNTCFRLQHNPRKYQSLLGLTIAYKKGVGTPNRTLRANYVTPPAMIILLSTIFSLEEAILFWNLRANGIYMCWLPLLEVEKANEEIVKVLESSYLESMLWANSSGGITFAAPYEEQEKLRDVFSILMKKRKERIFPWSITTYEALIQYDLIQQPIKEERIIVAREGAKLTFIPQLPNDNSTGHYSVALKWDDCMLPQSNELVCKHILERPFFHFPFTKEDRVKLLAARITKEHYLKMQVDAEKPIEFYKPTSEQTVEVLFTEAGFSRIERSSAAKYHTSFINRVGGLEKVNQYLARSPYKTLLEILADNKAKGKPGWIVEHPSKRRVVHHLQLREVLGKGIPDETRTYFNTVSDELPEEAFHLLEKGLLERGFLLSCTACSFRSWYPAQHVGQTFECTSCLQVQVYHANPLWLYKLPEVIFRGFEDNMHVPLLALNYLRQRSKHVFEWVPDSDIYLAPNDTQPLGNVDLLCLSDGRFYIGEAKSNDIIEPKQFSFYEQLCRQVALDGIVFATSQPLWGRATQQRIDALKTWFAGEVLVLTEKNLYSETA